MTAKECLQQIRVLESKIQALEMELEQLRYEVYGITSSGTTGERVQTSAVQDKLTPKVAKLMDMSSNLTEIIHHKAKVRHEIVKMITDMNNSQYIDVLMKRYVFYKQWNHIAEEMHISIQLCYVIHNKALEEFDKLLKSRDN